MIRNLPIRSTRRRSIGLAAFGLTAALGCSSAPPVDTDAPVEANPDGTLSTVAGTGSAGFGGDGGLAFSAALNAPSDIAITDSDTLLIADSVNHRVRALDLTNGRISTVAGNGTTTGADSLNLPTGLTSAPDGGFYVTAWAEQAVYSVSASGTRARIIGTGDAVCQEPGGLAIDAAVVAPRSVAVMVDGSVLVSEQGCHRVVRVTLSGAVQAYAGSGAPGYSGDGESATAAMLNAGAQDDGPSLGISLSPEDPPDELFIADTANHVIRQVKLFTGRIETLAGTGEPGFCDGPPNEAQFNRPTHVFADRDHSVWVVDSGNHAIRYIDPLATRVTTVAGTGTAGFNGDGRAPTATQLRDPRAVCVDASGRVFIADTGNHRIRLYAGK